MLALPSLNPKAANHQTPATPSRETASQPPMTLILSGNRRSATISSPVGP
jgi:hypothetical protein